ncbi:MAG: InlB B-repeat-containing protein [Bacilli bacterium]|nr:InlB B-repeat-containing protein [Bacilli bacterium]
MKKVLLFVFVLFLSLVVVCCGNESYTITYDLDGGVCDSLVYEYTEGDEVVLPTPTKEGFTFLGWYLGDVKVELIKQGNFNLVAKWEKNEESLKDKYECITVAEAISLANAAGETGTTESYYIYGVIESVSNPTYGEMTISDETGSIYVYGTYDANGEKRYSELDDKPVAGDEVVLYGPFKMYKGTPEMAKGWIKDFKHAEVEIDPSEYPAKTIKEARSLEDESKVTLEGVVAYITYANGLIPNGFYLVDSTAAIYVYGEIAASVNVGNKVKIAGEKIHYLDSAAQGNTFGYPGALQIAGAVVLENDKGNNEFDKTWISDSTVKEIMDTDPSEDITSNIYKVNALIKKDVKPGFVNYYINDLDGKTGSYVYTQCNGSDFEWLDEFDQKICTVYLSPLNAKVSDAGCIYRFIPVAVSFDNYQFNEADAAQFALDYYAVDQFLDLYKSDPNLEVITSVSNELLGFSDVTLTYEAADTKIINFNNVDGKVVMNALMNGTTDIIIIATYKTYTARADVTVNIDLLGDVDAMTVKECLDSENNTECTVKGIVASSLVNQKGFYLIDETGVIAVRTTDDVLADLQVGHEVIMKGTKVVYESSKGLTQQICLLDSELVINYYGEHQYSKASFDSTKTLEDLTKLSTDEFHTTQVYVLQVKVEFVEAQYYSNCYVKSEDGNVQMLLYTSNGSQYNWLKDLAGKVVTVEMCLCDWNNKSEWRGCILSITDGETTLNNTLNFSK